MTFALLLGVPVALSAAAAPGALQKAKQEAEAKGFVFETSRDEIIASLTRLSQPDLRGRRALQRPTPMQSYWMQMTDTSTMLELRDVAVPVPARDQLLVGPDVSWQQNTISFPRSFFERGRTLRVRLQDAGTMVADFLRHIETSAQRSIAHIPDDLFRMVAHAFGQQQNRARVRRKNHGNGLATRDTKDRVILRVVVADFKSFVRA